MRHELPVDNPNYRPARYTVKASGDDSYAKGGGQAFRQTTTPDYQPSCKCNVAPRAGIVLDPFGGAGTTGVVAQKHGRNAILIELNPAYSAMADKRIADAQLDPALVKMLR